jgi:DNA polymerase-3 subunit alpha
MKYGGNLQNAQDSNQISLFDESNDVEMPEPLAPTVEPWNALYALNREKEVVGIYISGHPLDDFKYEIKTFCSTELSELEDLQSFEKRDIKIAGIVTSAENRVSKKGNKYGHFTLEDFSGPMEMVIFGEDYLRFNMYMVEDACLFVKAKVDKKKFGEEKELKIQSIELLSELRNQHVKELQIKLENKTISASFVQDVFEICSQNPGKCTLRFIIEDPVNKISVNMPSKTFRVDLNDNLIKQLEEKNLDFQLVG